MTSPSEYSNITRPAAVLPRLSGTADVSQEESTSIEIIIQIILFILITSIGLNGGFEDLPGLCVHIHNTAVVFIISVIDRPERR